MPKKSQNGLTYPIAAAAVEEAKSLPLGKSRKLTDGRSVALVCSRTRAFWVFNYRDPTTGKLRSAGLGSFETTSPSVARKKADALRSGATPLPVPRHARVVAPGASLADALREWLANHGAELNGEIERYTRLLEKAIAWAPDKTTGPIAQMALTDIKPHHVAAMLRQPWKFPALKAGEPERLTTDDGHETLWQGPGRAPGKTVRSYVEKAIGAKIANGLDIPNPAPWTTLQHLMHKKTAHGEGKAAMPYADVPAFYAANPDPALRFLILTAARRGEVCGDKHKPIVDWSEIDLDAREWTVPAEKMKGGKPHVVPLSDAAIACLPPRQKSGPIFEGTSRVITHRLGKLLEGTRSDVPGRPATLHGFRSTYTNWETDTTGSDMIAQLSLAHAAGSKVSRSYRRSTAIDKRRLSLEAWAAFVNAKETLGSP